MKKKIAVVLMNLGGPSDLDAVQPFLFNLFYDPAILRLPNPWRFLLARFIAWRRTSTAVDIYKQMGEKSPILEETKKQAQALEKSLSSEKDTYKVFVCMRYWHPRALDVLEEVKAFGATDVVLLPLYPQFSTTTTQSSLREWHQVSRKQKWHGNLHRASCFFYQPKYLDAVEEKVRAAYEQAKHKGPVRILWTAHGLPKKIVDSGDPYQWHVEHTVDYLRKRLKDLVFDDVVCYQSRVGPLKWIGPYTEDEIARAGKDNKSLVVVPVSFVSEHSETLVELDIEYKELAEENNISGYVRAETVRDHASFIEGLRDLTLLAQSHRQKLCAFCSEKQVQKCATRMSLQTCK